MTDGQPGGRNLSTRARGLRLFAAPADEPRARRATDGVVLVVAATILALLSLVTEPAAGFERAFIAFLRSFPSSVDGLWQALLDGLALAAVALLAVTLARRRWSLLRDEVLTLALVVVGTLVVAKVVEDAWPALWDAARASGPPPRFPSVRLGLPAAVVMATSPYLTRTARRVLRWLVVLAALAAVVLGSTTPTGAAAGVLLAVAAAAGVHLVFGSCYGRPSLADVSAALEALGVRVRSVGAADRQPAGYFLVDALDGDGRPLVVKVYGRDAHDTQLLTTLWRTVWYREAGSPLSFGRLAQVEHEAFLTLLAEKAGVPTAEVVTAAATERDDVLLVLRPLGRPIGEVPESHTSEVVRRVWDVVGCLHAAGIAHGQVDDRHLVADGQRIGLVDYRGASVAPEPAQLRTDDAQAFVTTALLVGSDVALDLAVDALGATRLAAVLPFVQETALTARQRHQVRDADLDLDDLRERAAARVGIETPELQRLRRVTWGSVIQVVLLFVAFVALASAFAGLDIEALGEELRDAVWWFVVVGFFIAQLPRVSQSVSTLGASPVPLPMRPVYALQLAISYVNLAVPSSAARIAVNVRFFQRHGLQPGTALAIGALDGFSSLVVQALLLVGILAFTPASLELDFSGAVSGGPWALLAIALGFVAVGIGTVLVVPKLRHAVFGRVRTLMADALSTLRGLHSPRRFGLLFGGNLATELAFATALGAFARAFGYPIGLTELVLINVAVGLLAGFVPIPGGIGVVEGGLTFGLVRAGMPEETAFAAVMLYRIACFYLPPIWGYFALKWLERNKHL